MKTEEEAKKCWCPFARRDASNRLDDDDYPDAFCRCIASACMAWRWTGVAITRQRYNKHTGEPIKLNQAYLASEVEERYEENDRRIGYCGLAGKSDV